MAIIDYVKYNGWSHAIHGETMTEVKNYGSWLIRFIDKNKKKYRASVMVHCNQRLKVKDILRYKVNCGIREVEIYDVKPCRNPRDMYTIYFLLKNNK